MITFRLAAASFILVTGAHAGTITLTVDPNDPTAYQTIAAATSFANADLDAANYYDIKIAPGTYTNDFANVIRPMTIEANGGPVTMLANSALLFDKGIIVTTSSLTVRGLTLQGAAIDNALGGNGAGIRDQSTGATTLRVEDSTFLKNQDGILTAGSNHQEIVQIINSQFLGNGNITDPGGQEHALYVGDAASLLVSGSTFCGTEIGHNIKSRAAALTVASTAVYDGIQAAACAAAGIGAGSSSFSIEAANGGKVQLIDDTIIQGALTQNTTMVRYGSDGLGFAENSLAITNTSFSGAGVGIQGTGPAGTCQLSSNTTFSGVTTPVSPASFCVAAPPPGPIAVREPASTLGLLLLAFFGLGFCWATTRIQIA
jgi:hypothetical protein